MAHAGAEILYETTARAAMTFHALRRVFEFKRLLKQAKEIYRDPARKPDLQICVDSSGVNLYFARAAKEAGIPVLYYVAPQLWASRPGRIKQVRRYIDRLACIFPFEAAWYQSRGANASFVGHPLFDDLPKIRQVRSDGGQRPTVGIVPGSRRSEVKTNLPHLIEVMQRIQDRFPDAQFLVPTTLSTHEMVVTSLSGKTVPGVREQLEQQSHARDGRATVKQNAFDEFIPQCDLVITKSGTSTVHVAAYAVPMIVVYRGSIILWHLIARWLLKTKKVAMVNILAGETDLVPEFIPWHGSNKPVADLAIQMLEHPQMLEDQRVKLRELIKPIEAPGASLNVAKIAMEMIAADARR